MVTFHVVKEANFKTFISKLFSKIPNRKKISNEQFQFCKATFSLEEVIKYVNSQSNSKCPGNNGLTAEFYKHFSNELSPILLDVYDSWDKLRTMEGSSRTRIISVVYKKSYKKDIPNYRLISPVNLDYNIKPTLLKNRM